MANCFDLTGRVAVVVGGTSGIGAAIARGFEEYGARVVAAGRRSAEWGVDVRSRASMDGLRDRVAERFGGVDVLVNAAGYTMRRPTREVSETEWADMMDTHVTGALRGCQSFYGLLKSSGRGRVIMIASLSSFVAFHEVAAYGAAKTALVSLTRNLACEWAQDGIAVNAIAPGVFPTEMNRGLVEGTGRGRELLMRTPMRRFGRAEELVGLAVLLASDGASYLTGQCIAVDGGFLASGVNS